MEPRLLVVTSFGPSASNELWYRLQRSFLAKTTEVPYDYRVVLNGVSPEGFARSEILHAFEENQGHARALEWILAHCRSHPHGSYLILDSDCFPVHPGWHGVLMATLARFRKRIAAPVRTENLDLFPHPCAFFLVGDAVLDPAVDFAEGRKVRNLLGEDVEDVGTGMQGLTGTILPLLRSNAVNVHPVAAALYHHLFYHHGAGSRHFGFRLVNAYGLCRHWLDPSTDQMHRKALLEALERDPEGFIAMLRGTGAPILSEFMLPQGR